MSTKEKRRRCAHPGCRAWVRGGGELCDGHGGRSDAGGEVPAEVLAACERPGGGARVPTLDEEIARLAAQRDRAERWLERQMAEGEWRAAEVMRCLAVLSQVGKGLAALLLRRGEGSGASEVERFLEVVARRVRDRGEE